MNIAERYKVIMNETADRFEVQTDEDVAYLDYRWYHETFILLYVFVPPAYRGKGISNILIQHALEYAKSKEVKIKVFCPYIAKYIRMHPEYQELLEKV